MKRALSRAFAFGLSAATAGLFAPSCAAVIGVNDYRDAIAEICQCEEIEAIADCTARGTQLLEKHPDDAKEWIKDFSKDDCACKNAVLCISRPPFCATCSELILGRSEDFLSLCEASYAPFIALAQCICTECDDACGASYWCTEGSRFFGEGCGACAQNRCSAVIGECVADAPPE
jgi:hypothetical protein